ncbi:MAG: cytochrome c family protein [Desulfatitalea sp.]|nr:cytochrome c family protein [Desulfatitalea sp.]
MSDMLRYFILMAVLFTVPAVALQAEDAIDRGARQIILEGGASGSVPFAHQRHQNTLKDDCMVCHALFDQKKGAIKTGKADGRLKQKQVMNALCIHCHRNERQAGNPGGPTACAKCHIRE